MCFNGTCCNLPGSVEINCHYIIMNAYLPIRDRPLLSYINDVKVRWIAMLFLDRVVLRINVRGKFLLN